MYLNVIKYYSVILQLTKHLNVSLNYAPRRMVFTPNLGGWFLPQEKMLRVHISEMNVTGTLPQAGNLNLFVPSLSTQGSTRPKQNMFNVVLMRPDKTE